MIRFCNCSNELVLRLLPLLLWGLVRLFLLLAARSVGLPFPRSYLVCRHEVCPVSL